jgi:hypothetical protein
MLKDAGAGAGAMLTLQIYLDRAKRGKGLGSEVQKPKRSKALARQEPMRGKLDASDDNDDNRDNDDNDDVDLPQDTPEDVILLDSD